MPRPTSNRLDFIDSLRAVAVLLVLVLHTMALLVGLPFPSRAGFALHAVAQTLDFGRIGVVLFFAVSGFVIPFSLSARHAKPLLHFAVHRVFRLYPAYWVSIVTGVLGVWLVHDGRTVDSAMMRVVAVNLTMLQGFFGVQNVLGLYWTLQIELVFYAACALLFALGLLGRPRVILGLAALLAVVGRAPLFVRLDLSAIPWLPDLAVMFWGCAVRLWLDGRLGRGERLAVVTVALGWTALLPFEMFRRLRMNPDLDPGTVSQTLAYALGVGLFWLGALRIRLRGRVLAWLGRISYSLYLFHPPVIYLGAWWVGQHPDWLRVPLPVWLLVLLALTVAVANATFTWIEQPANAAGRTCAARLGTSQA